jgi:hypothetical protein
MKPPRHFTLVVGRIEHLSLGRHIWSFCGRDISRHPRREGLTAAEALRRVKCKVCKRCVKPQAINPFHRGDTRR